MTELRHAPGAPDAATRPPEPTMLAAESETLDLGPEIAARAAATVAIATTGNGAARDQQPTPHGLPPGAIGAAALLGIQRAACNRAAAGLVMGVHAASRPGVRTPGHAGPMAPAGPGATAARGPATVGLDAAPASEQAVQQAAFDAPAIDALHGADPPGLETAPVVQRLTVQRGGPSRSRPPSPSRSSPTPRRSTSAGRRRMSAARWPSRAR